MIDWQQVLLNIRASGMPMSRVAERIGMDDYTLRRYARGEMNNPRWSQALAMLDLHHECCLEKHALHLLWITRSPRAHNPNQVQQRIAA